MIPMDEQLWTALSRHQSWYLDNLGAVRPEWYLFPSFGKARKPSDPSRPATTIKTAWQRVKKDLNIDYRLHDTRHSVATALAVAGVPEAKRRYLMGHVDEGVIKRYTHLQAEDCREDLERALKLRRSSSGVPTVSTVEPGRLKIVRK